MLILILSYLLVFILVAFLVSRYLLPVNYIEGGIAGDVRSKKKKAWVSVRIPMGTTIRTPDGVSYDLWNRDKCTVLRTCGSSMVERNIFDGDLSVFDKKVTPAKGDVIAIRISDRSDDYHGQIKYRIFDGFEDGKVNTKKYEKGEVVSSARQHKAKNLLGTLVAVFDKGDTEELLAKIAA